MNRIKSASLAAVMLGIAIGVPLSVLVQVIPGPGVPGPGILRPGVPTQDAPEIKKERWQVVRGIPAFDNSGRLWLLVIDYARSGGTFLCCPDDAGRKIPLADPPSAYRTRPCSVWIDSRNRAWCNFGASLCCVDLVTGQCTSRSAQTTGLDPRVAANSTFRPVHLEGPTGAIYVLDSAGLHVFDGQNWSFQALGDSTTPGGHPYDDYDADQGFVKCPSGQVIFCGPQHPPTGFYIHDGTRWLPQSCELPAGGQNHPTAVLPLQGQKAIALFRDAAHMFLDLPAASRPQRPVPESMEIAATITRLGDADQAKRNKAREDLAAIAKLDEHKALATAKLVSDPKLQAAAVEIIKKAAASAASEPTTAAVPAKDVETSLCGAALVCQGKAGEYLLRGGADEAFRLMALFPDGHCEMAPKDFPRFGKTYDNLQTFACPFGDKIVINTSPAVLWDGAKFSLLDLDLISTGASSARTPRAGFTWAWAARSTICAGGWACWTLARGGMSRAEISAVRRPLRPQRRGAGSQGPHLEQAAGRGPSFPELLRRGQVARRRRPAHVRRLAQAPG